MPENENPTTEAPAQEPTEKESEGQETDWKAAARKWEQRAKDSHKRVQELEPFEAKARELEEASKSELEKAQERAERAERALAEASASAVRAEVAAEKGVPVALLSGDSREALIASAEALLAFRDETARQGNYVPAEGRSPNTNKGDPQAFVNSLWENAQKI